MLDIVYLYVNSTTKEWYNEYSKYKKDVCPDRFSFNGEIYFSLLSVQKFMPFINNIFLIVSGPDQHLDLTIYQDLFVKKIKYVYHKDIIPEKYLPTFNSTVIEFFIHNIKDLNEYFIHANDDLIINKNLNSYYYENDNPIITYFDYKHVFNKKIDQLNDYDKTVYITELLFTTHFDKPMLYEPIHNFTVFKKSAVKMANELIHDYCLDLIFQNKFRNQIVPDINTVYLFLNISLLEHKHFKKYVNYNLFIINTKNNIAHMDDINEITPNKLKEASLICYNSIITQNDKKLFLDQMRIIIENWSFKNKKCHDKYLKCYEKIIKIIN